MEVVDDGAGRGEGMIDLFATWYDRPQPEPPTLLKAPITDGFRITNVPSSAITEGKKSGQWFVTTWDKVGNTPEDDGTTVNEAPKGAAPP